MVLREKALRGDPRGLDRILELALRLNNDVAEIGSGQSLAPDDQAILDAYVAEKIATAPVTSTTAETPDHLAPEPDASSVEKDCG